MPRAATGLTGATAAGLLLAVLWAGSTVWLAWQAQWSGPFRDMWEIMPLLESSFDGRWRWADFWAPYGGAHRLFIPQWLFVLDLHWLQGSNRLPLTVSLACQGLILAVVVQRMRVGYPAQPLLPWLAASLALVTLFSGTQLYNFNYSISGQWFLATALSTLALAWASLPLPTRPLRRILGLIGIGLVASVVNSAGILLWPVLAWLLWLRRTPWPWLAALLITGLVMIAFYLHGLKPGLPTTGGTALGPWLVGMLLYSLRFVSGYLASPLSRHWPLAGSLLALAALTLLLIDGWRRRQAPAAADTGLRLLTAGMALHAALIAFTAGLGRTMYANMQTTERYQTGALFFWLAVALAALAVAQRRGGGWRLLLPLPLLLLALGVDHGNSSRKHVQLANTVQQTHVGLALGVTELPVAVHTLSFPAGLNAHNYVAWHADFLRAQRLGPWHNPLLAWQGRHWPVADPAPDCTRHIQRGEAVNAAGAQRVSVQADCLGRPRYLVLVDAHRQVIGLARRALPDWPPLQHQTPRWDGFVTHPTATLLALPATEPADD